MCDKVVVLNAGRLEQVGTPRDLYERPATPFVAGFVGRTNRLSAVAERGALAIHGQHLCPHHVAPGAVTLLIRPHRVRLLPGVQTPDPAWTTVQGYVVRTTYAGDLLHTEVAVGPQTVTVERPTAADDEPLAPGAPVTLVWRPDDMLVFGAAA